MTAYLAALAFVVLAEMGDKTQLLAMAFATRFKASHVLIGVFVATIFNHALAVLLGRFLSTAIPLDLITTIAALSFIFFGLWTLRGDELDGEDKKPSKFGPIVTVAIAFFIAELGDKTQLATISLAVQYKNSLAVLLGTTTGMLIADGIGIIIGIVLGKRIPEKAVKWVSAIVFMLFGLGQIIQISFDHLQIGYALGLSVLVLVATIAATYFVVKKGAAGERELARG